MEETPLITKTNILGQRRFQGYQLVDSLFFASIHMYTSKNYVPSKDNNYWQ